MPFSQMNRLLWYPQQYFDELRLILIDDSEIKIDKNSFTQTN